MTFAPPASTVQAIEAAREFGFEIVGAMCLVEREEAGGPPERGESGCFGAVCGSVYGE